MYMFLFHLSEMEFPSSPIRRNICAIMSFELKCILLLCSHSLNDVPHEPQRNVTMAIKIYQKIVEYKNV